ncbi:uncharacterized protein A1O5_02216 [Cladophialophora psammophila CBS 110553]|uniref:Carboxylesterase type B domain-containing protein n=1 Tax=Cladophialophora psammophila CBS 110553 TaxID=1182543 RepID=W9X0D8_9EURO|nr:uncharacterized protein A1O5_02216 [Cladophialophora psammophila CBS 110553]EXJ73922.1 hypothetical protein A1O5_02216 [Cladophialophora psammophila CBS 110553]
MLSHLLLAALFSASNANPISLAAPTATIDSGVVIGTATSLANSVVVDKFLGIPFAASPTRFAPPATPTPWPSPFHATKFGPACIQQFNYPEASRNLSIYLGNTPPPPTGESEDCLNVNVWVPRTTTKAKTVMVWIYGGSKEHGANSLPEYDGTSFAGNQDVIIVSLNYRTNVFGFPNAPELPVGERNLGFLDQRFGLAWVQRNIAAFNGNPEKVTIFGESAGAGSVDALVTTFPTNPPFRAAIMQSGQASFNINPTNAPTSWLTLAAALNSTSHSSNLTCLRSFPAAVLKSTIERLALPWPSVNDNVTSLRYSEAARVSRSIASVPILLGTNGNEATVLTIGETNTTAFVETWVPLPAVQTVLAAYPPDNPNSIANFFTDYAFHCPAAIVANDSRAVGFPTWRYFFNATFANTQVLPGLKVYHGSEIEIVFGTYPQVNSTEGEARLSRSMQSAWAAFAKAPNGGPGWSQVPNVAVLGPGVGVYGDGTGDLRRIVQAGSLDGACGLFREIFEAVGVAVAGFGG